MRQAIYLDHNASTPVAREALEAMLPWFGEQASNPGSAHAGGRQAARAIAVARECVADLLGGRPSEIVFTSGATESNNLAIHGVVDSDSRRRRVVVAATEHK